MRHFLFFLLFTQAVQAQVYSVFFSTDQSTVSSKYQSSLDSAIATAKKTNLPVNIFCHCDSRADSIYNYNLSMRRAKAVKAYLETRGTFSKIFVTGLGEDHPDFPNTPAMRYKNRRCDVKIGAGLVEVETQNFSETDVTKIKPGTLLQLDGLEFVGNQAIPNYYSMQVLYHLLEVMRTHPGLEILLKGHVCCGDDEPLSEARANVVFKFLVANGIDSARIQFKGYSNTQPLVQEVDEDTQQRNRRVEILVKKNTEEVVALNKNLGPPVFGVPLRDIRFKDRTQYPLGQSVYNLNLIADMIETSNGYFYQLYVYASNTPLVAKRRNYLESFFRKRRIMANKIKIIPSQRYNKEKGDMLILEVKPLEE